VAGSQWPVASGRGQIECLYLRTMMPAKRGRRGVRKDDTDHRTLITGH